MFNNQAGDWCDVPGPRFSKDYKRSLFASKPSYRSKYSQKVRQDFHKNKQHWSSMGLPSSFSEPQLHNVNQVDRSPKLSLPDMANRRSLRSLQHDGSVDERAPLAYEGMNGLQFRNLVPRSKWESYYKKRPVLVRSKNQVNADDDGKLPPIVFKSDNNTQVFLSSDSEEKLEASNSVAQLPAIQQRPESSHTEYSSASARTRHLESGNVRNLLCPLLPSSTHENGQYKSPIIANILNKEAPPECSPNAKVLNFPSEKALCDALILQKLMEIREELEKETKCCSHCGKGQNDCAEGDDNFTGRRISSTERHLPEHCNPGIGDVEILDRGHKDFVFENALKCARMQPKLPPKVVIDDGRGHTTALSPRMVFKKVI